METTNKDKWVPGMEPKINVIGHIDLDSMNMATRPKKTTKEERAAKRQQNMEDQKEHAREVLVNDLIKKRDSLQEAIREAIQEANNLRKHISDLKNAGGKERKEQEARLAYLKEKQAVRERYMASPITNDQRQKELTFQGIRPKKMDVVHFHVPTTSSSKEMDGVALVRDENHYYMAIDMYDRPDQEDNATTMMDVNPDGTFEGIWPKYTILKPAQKFEERFVRNLAEKYADDLSATEEFVETICRKEKEEIEHLTEVLTAYVEADNNVIEGEQALAELGERIKRMNGDLLSTDAELRRHRQEGTADTSADEGLLEFADDVEYEPIQGLDLDTPTEQKYRHLSYVRGHRQMLTMNWPQIETSYEGWLRFRLMGNVARLVRMLNKARALTYVLSEDYYEELSKRGREYYKGMKIDDVVPHEDSSSGIIVYPSQGYQDTVLYRIDNRNQLSIIVAYLREDRLMFYESYSMQEVINRPRTDSFICDSLRESGTEPNRLFGWIRNLIIAHLAMEHDMERTIHHLVEENKGSAMEKEIGDDDDVDTTDDHDVMIRDYTWYTDITVNREIPVRGYLSHRWCGSGKEKVIKEVWVRPHVKNGYHRAAGVKKQ